MESSSGKHAKVLLINPAAWQKESVNLGLAYLAGSLAGGGHNALILDFILRKTSDAEIIEKAQAFSPDLIGLSVKTATAREAGRVARLLSQVCSHARFVAGGPHVTLCGEDYLRDFPEFHYGLKGEAEESAVELADAIANNRQTRGIQGIIYRENGAILSNAWQPVQDLERLALPDFDAIEGFDWEGFRYPIVTSRGCPFSCVYCCVNKLAGSKKWRPRSVQNVVDELGIVATEKGIKFFETLDDNFTLSVSRAKRICRELIDRKLNLSWYCHNGIRADRIDRELALLMKEAGCTSVAFGMESGYPETFGRIRKGEPLSAISEAVHCVKEVGMKAVGYFIIGLPGDTLDQFIQTVQYQRSLALDDVMFGMLVPYPKTEVWDIIQRQGRMLRDITQTQQFGDDLVPVAFEFPEFPEKDMVRAFYISKYFELYQATQRLLDAGELSTVIYVTTNAIGRYLPGMFAACHPDTLHIVVGASRESVVGHPSFQWVAQNVSIEFSQTVFRKVAKRAGSIIVCDMDRIDISMLLRNTDLMVINPSTPYQMLIRVRDSIKQHSRAPTWILGLLATMLGLLKNGRRFGLGSIFRTVGRMAKRELLDVYCAIRGLPVLAWYMMWFIGLRAYLKRKSDPPCEEFPIDDHPSYM